MLNVELEKNDKINFHCLKFKWFNYLFIII